MKRSAKITAAVVIAAVLAVIGVFLPVPKSHFIYTDNGQGITIEKYNGHRPYVNIPAVIDGKNVTAIGDSAFYRDKLKIGIGIMGVNIPDTVTSIGKKAFYGCGLKSLDLPEDLEKMGEFAFDGNAFVTAELPDTVTELPNGCFDGCSRLKSVRFKNVKKIGDRAFEYCGALESVSLDSGLEYIGESAFEHCAGFDIGQVPESVEYIGFRALSDTMFDEKQSGDMIIFNDRLLYKYSGSDESPVIPESVTAICGGAFRNSGIKNIELGENIKYVGGSAFYGCNGLEKIVLPEGAALCGDNNFADCKRLEYARLGCKVLPYTAFEGCESLKNVEFTEKPQVIEGSAFADCYSLECFADENAVEVGNFAFNNCTSLKTVELPNVKTLGSNVFKGSGLEGFEIPDGIKQIDSGTFADCKNLKSVKLPNSTETIGDDAFLNCKALKEISLPDGLKNIYSRAFFGSGVEKIDMPDTVIVLDDAAFRECGALESISFSNGLDGISMECCCDCPRLRSVTLPSNVKTIDMLAFWKDKSLEHIDLPDGLEKIDMNAFMDTGIWEVFIPDSVNDFDRQAFCCDDHGVLIMHTANCAAAGQIEQARQWGIVHDRYYVNVVRSRSEEEEIYNSSKNN